MDSHAKAQQIETELVELLYKQAPSAFMATLLNGGIITCVLWSQVSPSLLIIWLILIGAITAYRFELVRRHRRTPLVADQAVSWRTRFIVGTGAAGAVWGAAAIFLFPSESLVHQVFLVFMLGGIAAGAVATLSSVMAAFFAFSSYRAVYYCPTVP